MRFLFLELRSIIKVSIINGACSSLAKLGQRLKSKANESEAIAESLQLNETKAIEVFSSMFSRTSFTNWHLVFNDHRIRIKRNRSSQTIVSNEIYFPLEIAVSPCCLSCLYDVKNMFRKCINYFLKALVMPQQFNFFHSHYARHLSFSN